MQTAGDIGVKHSQLELVDRIGMRKTDCFGKTRPILHVPSWKAFFLLLLLSLCIIIISHTLKAKHRSPRVNTLQHT